MSSYVSQDFGTSAAIACYSEGYCRAFEGKAIDPEPGFIQFYQVNRDFYLIGVKDGELDRFKNSARGTSFLAPKDEDVREFERKYEQDLARSGARY